MTGERLDHSRPKSIQDYLLYARDFDEKLRFESVDDRHPIGLMRLRLHLARGRADAVGTTA